MRKVGRLLLIHSSSCSPRSPVTAPKVEALQVPTMSAKTQRESTLYIRELFTDDQTAGGLMVHSQQVHKCEPEPYVLSRRSRGDYALIAQPDKHAAGPRRLRH
jgi:hypothetical protein